MNMSFIGGGIVSMFASCVEDLWFESRSVKSKTIKLVFASSSTTHYLGVRTKIVWLRIKVSEWKNMLTADYCVSELTLYTFN